MTDLLNLTGRTAVIFGGVGNLGTYIVRKLYEHGANVVVSYYKGEDEKAREFLKSLDPSGNRSFALYCDIADEDSVKAFVENSKEHFGTLEIAVNLVHNPDWVPTNVADVDWSYWRDNLIAQKGHFLICKHILRPMRKQHYGRIIYISGGLAVRHMGGSAAFSSIKAGLTVFSKTLAIEEGPNNITVNIVAPGRITPLESDGTFSWDESSVELLKKTPLGRFATQDDVANAVLYFASPIAEGITGQTLYVACGEIML